MQRFNVLRIDLTDNKTPPSLRIEKSSVHALSDEFDEHDDLLDLETRIYKDAKCSLYMLYDMRPAKVVNVTALRLLLHANAYDTPPWHSPNFNFMYGAPTESVVIIATTTPPVDEHIDIKTAAIDFDVDHMTILRSIWEAPTVVSMYDVLRKTLNVNMDNLVSMYYSALYPNKYSDSMIRTVMNRHCDNADTYNEYRRIIVGTAVSTMATSAWEHPI